MEDERMENMNNFRERLEALEQQTKAMEAHTHTVERRLRWWRGIACGALMLGVLALTLPSGKGLDAQPGGLPERVAALEDKLAAVTFDAATNQVVITGANLRIVNGLGATDTTNGLGNLIVGYNESRPSLGDCPLFPTAPFCTDRRTGSHNVVVGIGQNFSKVAGLVVGNFNEISGNFASVSGGQGHTASNTGAAVSGGQGHTASGFGASVSGGANHTASGDLSSVSGGHNSTASNFFSSVSGGEDNTASGEASSVSGGRNRTAPAPFDWAAGPLFADF
jgi:hypothetical protein